MLKLPFISHCPCTCFECLYYVYMNVFLENADLLSELLLCCYSLVSHCACSVIMFGSVYPLRMYLMCFDAITLIFGNE